ncbi:hypothetical protein ABH897_002319 [Paenibacillus sp. RC73]|uniref:hypothetical protein n=1 Tax=Paenibacillus sp. RC73 TaxID=3156250 RepID=UPI00383916AC
MDSILKDVSAVGERSQADIIGHLTWGGLAEMLITPDDLNKSLLIQDWAKDGRPRKFGCRMLFVEQHQLNSAGK